MMTLIDYTGLERRDTSAVVCQWDLAHLDFEEVFPEKDGNILYTKRSVCIKNVCNEWGVAPQQAQRSERC